jgi:hypothetical protein
VGGAPPTLVARSEIVTQLLEPEAEGAAEREPSAAGPRGLLRPCRFGGAAGAQTAASHLRDTGELLRIVGLVDECRQVPVIPIVQGGCIVGVSMSIKHATIIGAADSYVKDAYPR